MSDTQLICTTKPYCICANGPNVWDECCCTGNMAGCRNDVCEACGATLIRTTPEPNEIIEIDINTGEPITQ